MLCDLQCDININTASVKIISNIIFSIKIMMMMIDIADTDNMNWQENIWLNHTKTPHNISTTMKKETNKNKYM